MIFLLFRISVKLRVLSERLERKLLVAHMKRSRPDDYAEMLRLHDLIESSIKDCAIPKVFVEDR